MPPGAYNRLADNWRPLFAIAQAAGGDWPRRALEAFNHLTNPRFNASTVQRFNDSTTDTQLLLADIRQIFNQSGRTRLSSKELVDSLCALPDRPWRSLAGTSQSSLNWLARRLRPRGISSRNIREGELRAKGYVQADFTGAFARLVAPESEGGG